MLFSNKSQFWFNVTVLTVVPGKLIQLNLNELKYAFNNAGGPINEINHRACVTVTYLKFCKCFKENTQKSRIPFHSGDYTLLSPVGLEEIIVCFKLFLFLPVAHGQKVLMTHFR